MSIRQNVRWGWGWGVWMGTCYAVIGAVITLVRGPTAFRQFGLSPVFAIVLYLAEGLFAGLVVGLLRPLTRWAVGASLVGILAIAPFAFIAYAVLPGNSSRLLLPIVYSIMLGGGGGFAFWMSARPAEVREHESKHIARRPRRRR